MKILRLIGVAAACVSLILAAVYYIPRLLAPADRNAIATEADYFGDGVNHIIYLPQNWSAADSQWFYTTPQGAILIPYALFMNLEQADSQQLFRSNENMLRYRYLIQRADHRNPDGLPVGFVKDQYRGQAYLGFTCAACHTTQLNYQGVGIRIDGGPALADMESFLLDLADTLQATLDNPDKLSRLTAKLAGDTSATQIAQVRTLVAKIQLELQENNRINQPLRDGQWVHYGFGRLDMLGRAYNQVLSHLTPGATDNANPANAPVSYPALWDTAQHDFVFWNGMSPNTGSGALARNVGHALGVSAALALNTPTANNGYRSSIKKSNLVRLEHQLQTLQSPRWPDVFPAIDTEKAARGRKVFETYRCQQCHQAIDPQDPTRKIRAQLTSLNNIDTDPAAALNALNNSGDSGLFAGLPLQAESPDGPKFAAQTRLQPLLAEVERGILAHPDPDQPALFRRLTHWLTLFSALHSNPVGDSTRTLDAEPNTEPALYLRAYKARPLNGIWATPPYLHNGSVASLYELFLPGCDSLEASTAAPGSNCRRSRFSLGSREFDPVKVGYRPKSPERFPNLTVFDTGIPGNNNAGHEYAAGKTPVIILGDDGKPINDESGQPRRELLPAISDEDRWALIEYLKTL